ncbi:MAG: histidine--tRNA ligase [Dehalococcoidales bacterium]|nr:histidine--tRNA ligase [Dehalococcoidales bacterium]
MYQAVRGTSDILPAEQPYWRYVEQAVADISRLYGYQRIDTPVFEDTSLFSRSTGEYTDIVQKEMYTFDDRGGNSLTLKPEGTPAVCRAYIQHGLRNLPQPVKLYYISPIFRYDRPQAGRYRQHYQFGYEAIGEADPAIDAEVIDMAWQFYKSLGLAQISLQLNSIGCKTCRPGYLSALKDYYTGHINGLCSDCKIRLEKNPLRLLDCKQPSCQRIAEAAPKNANYLCKECDEHFKKLQEYLKLLGIPFELNHRLVRGLDYYTRTVFEIQPEEEGAQSALGGGGRYDDLIEGLGGKPTPGIGFAAGIERIILNLKKQGITVPTLPGLQVLIAYLGVAAREEATKLAASLRQAGISAATTTGGKSLKAQMRQANSLGVRYTVIIGEDEVKAGTATLRDMANARQETVPIGELPARIRRDS